MKKIKAFVIAHKFLSVLIVAAMLWGGYTWYSRSHSVIGSPRYVLGTAEKGTLVVSVTGSGQVSASDQLDIKPKVSGEIVYVGIKNAQEVRAGTLLAKIDTYDAEKAVSDAEINLEKEKLTLEKMKGLTNSDGTIRSDRQKALDDLERSYEDGFNAVANAFLDLPTIMAGLQDILYSNSFGIASQQNIDYYLNGIQNAFGTIDSGGVTFKNSADAAYQAARVSYDKTFSDYKGTNRFSSKETIEQLIEQTYETTKLVAEADKSSGNFLQYYKDRLTEHNIKPNSLVDTHLALIGNYTSKTNSGLLSLLTQKTNIQNYKEAIVNVGFSVSDQEIQVKQAERTLADANVKLSECYIYAPFSGMIVSVGIKKGDIVSSGSSIATLITAQRLAEVTLNEIDVSKIKGGEKATLTFDAIDGLTLTGTVNDIDSLGVVTQGVVTYKVRIAFDPQKNSIKPGMSVSAAIITDVHQDVLLVPSGAVKSQGGTAYVEMFDTQEMGQATTTTSSNAGTLSLTPPRRQTVEIGASNDSMTEITNGLNSGDSIVIRTVSETSAATQAGAQTSGGFGGIRIPGLGGGGGR